MMTVPSAPRIVNPTPKPARRPFGLGVFPRPPERLPVGPSPVDAAYHLGYTLGLDGIDAAPPAEMTPAEAAAFVAGWRRGMAEHDAHIEWLAMESAAHAYHEAGFFHA